jgi:hypothetical protein
MSPACQLEMKLLGGISGVLGDGSADERWGAEAARGAAGFGLTVACVKFCKSDHGARVMRLENLIRYRL